MRFRAGLKMALVGVLSLATLLLAQNIPVHAIDLLSDTCSGAASSSDFCKNVASEKGSDRILGKDGIVTKITKVVVLLAGAFSIIMVIIGGLRYVLSGGDSYATKGAKDTILYGIVGAVVAMFAQIMVSFVLSRL